MTVKGLSKVVSVTVAAVPFDAKTELGYVAGSHINTWQNLLITNLDPTNMVTVNASGTATLRGDDMETVLPRQQISIPWGNTLSLIADTATCLVEIKGA